MLRLGDPYAANARLLFFGQPPQAQIALFATLDNPSQVGDDLQTVIKGLYTALDPASNRDHTALLTAMSEALAKIEDDFPDAKLLSGEIEVWLQGRIEAENGNVETAIEKYTQAINYNNQNPAIYMDRALAYASLNDYDSALTDLNRIVELDATRQNTVARFIEDNSALKDYLQEKRAEFPALSQKN